MTRTILIVLDYYLPGYKGGGPIRAIENLVAQLGDEFTFFILTRDRDLDDAQPYPGIRHGEWMPVGKAWVRYLALQEMALTGWRRVLNNIVFHPHAAYGEAGRQTVAQSDGHPSPDFLYLNSFFSVHSVRIMILRRLRLIPQWSVIVAPRGEFFPGALALKTAKKRLYLLVSKLLRLYQDVLWQASSDAERQAIERMFPGVRCHIAPDLTPRLVPVGTCSRAPLTTDGITRMIFLSRIARNKNLDFALRLLADITANIHLDIYGPTADEIYWQECQALMAALPDNIHAAYKGIVAPDAVIHTFSQYDLFLFPTQGENFGHVIWEALAAGCLVLTSDHTPWHDLAAHGAGWTLPLDDPAAFRDAIEEVVHMGMDEFIRRARAAQDYAARVSQDDAALEANRALFSHAG